MASDLRHSSHAYDGRPTLTSNVGIASNGAFQLMRPVNPRIHQAVVQLQAATRSLTTHKGSLNTYDNNELFADKSNGGTTNITKPIERFECEVNEHGNTLDHNMAGTPTGRSTKGDRCDPFFRHLMINISTWGPQTIDFLKSEQATSYQSLGLTETHVPAGGCGEVRQRLFDLGFNAYLSPAIPSDRTATRGMLLLLITVYMTCSLGIDGENIAKLAQIERLINETGIMYIITGDFNMDPSIIMASRWISRISGAVVQPEGITATCTNGGGCLTTPSPRRPSAKQCS